MHWLNVLILCFISHSRADHRRSFRSEPNNQLRTLVELLIDEEADNSQCIVTVVDTYYRRKVDISQIEAYNFLPMYRILIRESEEFSPPRQRLLRILRESKYVGCDFYLILMANGLQVANFLRYTEGPSPLHHSMIKIDKLVICNYDNEVCIYNYYIRETFIDYNKPLFQSLSITIDRERLINAHGKFVFVHDFRIFHKEMRYLWNRIINVIFIRHYVEFKRSSNRQLLKHEWYDLNTIPFPARTKGLVVTKYIDAWYQNRYRYGTDHFVTKTSDLRKQKLRVAVFQHIPAVTEDAESFFKDRNNIDTNSKPLGIEFEMMLIIAKALNFRPDFYQPENIQTERWGTLKNETFTGLFGEAKDGSAVFYLGDLHYTMRHLQILDLSWPYNTECLTFLTLESLTENSWKLLILPFRLQSWLALLFTLLFASVTFFFFSVFYKKYVEIKETNEAESFSPKTLLNVKNIKGSESGTTEFDEWESLYLFTDPQNSILYTYSMLLQVSLPSLPRAWSIRIFIGWWWIFTILITTTYKASMTATLANAIERQTIDTVAELVKAAVPVGSWTDETRDFFMDSSDSYLQRLAHRFTVTTNKEDAVAAVANGSLSYYENTYILGHERVKRQILEAEMQKNGTDDEKHKVMDHNLHIMDECVINMPISLGMDKHSPLKDRVDKLVKRIIEAGLVQKWLSDITQQSKILELRQEGTAQKALVDLEKLQGALVALGLGYLFGTLALGYEMWHWKYVVLRDPNFNKYRTDLFYKRM